MKEAELSKIIGEKWQNESEECKKVYYSLANMAKLNHKNIHQDYVYKPRRFNNKGSFGGLTHHQ
jgi:hypothetical protein